MVHAGRLVMGFLGGECLAFVEMEVIDLQRERSAARQPRWSSTV
jgi:hypothetical protein